MDFKNYSDAELKKIQKQTLAICSFTESGIRYGIETQRFIALAEDARNLLQKIEAEYFSRHPEAKQSRIQQFLQVCEGLFDAKNFTDYGDDKSAATQEYFVEYNTPEPGKKLVTSVKNYLDHEEKTQTEFPMTIADELYAELELAMDEYAETLPKVKEPNNA